MYTKIPVSSSVLSLFFYLSKHQEAVKGIVTNVPCKFCLTVTWNRFEITAINNLLLNIE